VNSLRVAAIQMNSGDDIPANLDAARRLLRQAAAEGCRLAVLPENFARMNRSDRERAAVAESDNCGPVQDFLAAEASATGMWLVAGTLPIASDDPARPYAACCVYADTGERVARYDKLHLFDVRLPGSSEAYSESAGTLPGSAPCVVDTPWGRLGIAVCYDLRFPELFYQMSVSGMDFLALPAAFTVNTGAAHWQVLLRARAIEHQCYVLGAAQTGNHPGGRSTWGHSMIIDPWGEILVDAGCGECMIAAELDRERLAGVRREFPVLQHRRFNTTGARSQASEQYDG